MTTHNYFPQLEYAFHNYWQTYGEITTTNLILPYCEVDTSGHPKSVFDLLFNNVYAEDSYQYKFNLVENTFLPKRIKERLNYSYNHISIYLSSIDSTALNVMSFTTENITMFDLLLQYRKGETPDLSSVTYSSLDSILSKLIYAYLVLMVNNNVDYMNSETSIAEEGNLLQILYELYVVNEVHRVVRS